MARKHGSHSVYQINYHIVFCSKRRKKCLVDDIAADLSKIIDDICKKNSVKIIKKEIMSDHVHLFVETNPKISPNTIVRRIKGASSNFLRKKYPQLKKIPAMWSSSYYCGSVGEVSSKVIQDYIKNQKGK